LTFEFERERFAFWRLGRRPDCARTIEDHLCDVNLFRLTRTRFQRVGLAGLSCKFE
jgi:hypothetical protein